MEEGIPAGLCIQARGFHQHQGGGGGGGTKCGRWNPTAEQVRVLTELFKAGLRTPSTDQIQKISAQLSFYGKIESKNVFYWFQNHKARERQKRRRVSKADNKVLLHHDKVASATPNYFCTESQVLNETEGVIETLQLFPLTSYDESQAQKLRTITSNEYYYCKENAFSYKTNGKEVEHPQLDLRLSFL